MEYNVIKSLYNQTFNSDKEIIEKNKNIKTQLQNLLKQNFLNNYYPYIITFEFNYCNVH